MLFKHIIQILEHCSQRGYACACGWVCKRPFVHVSTCMWAYVVMYFWVLVYMLQVMTQTVKLQQIKNITIQTSGLYDFQDPIVYEGFFSFFLFPPFNSSFTLFLGTQCHSCVNLSYKAETSATWHQCLLDQFFQIVSCC